MITVTGATGNVGRPLVQALTALGESVTAVARGAASPDTPPSVRHRQADLAEPESLRPVLAGSEALFLLVSGAGAHLNVHDILDVAKAGGVRRVVLLSSQAAGTRPQSSSHSPLRAIEDTIQQSGLEWTILRPGGFHTNAFAWAETVRSQRMISAPFADIALPSVDPADIAAVAAAVLHDRDHAERSYELTGPAATSPRQRAGAIADALGTPLDFVEQSRDEARTMMLRAMPEPVVDGTLEILGEPLAAEQRVSPDVELLLGRSPRSFADWAAQNVMAFR